jgi:hypothetical protein
MCRVLIAFNNFSLCILCSSTLFAERLIAFACVEGIFFSGRLSSLEIIDLWIDCLSMLILIHSKAYICVFLSILWFSASVPYSGLKRGE